MSMRFIKIPGTETWVNVEKIQCVREIGVSTRGNLAGPGSMVYLDSKIEIVGTATAQEILDLIKTVTTIKTVQRDEVGSGNG